MESRALAEKCWPPNVGHHLCRSAARHPLGTPTCEQNVKNPASWPYRATVAIGERGADGGDADLTRKLCDFSIQGGYGARSKP
jgi:hypothetical protein